MVTSYFCAAIKNACYLKIKCNPDSMIREHLFNNSTMDSIKSKMQKTVVFTFLQILLITVAFGQSAPPDDLSGNTLKTWLKDNWYTGKFTDIGYNDARRAMYSTIDARSDGRVYCVYTGFSQEAESTTHLNPINAEHSIPQSFFDSQAPMVSDIMHLFPTHGTVNGARSSNPFDDISDTETDTWYIGTQAGLETRTSIPTENIDDYSEKRSNAFEPREDHKGDLARVIFYFFTVYDIGKDIDDLALGGDIDMLYQWHKDDPVDDWERTRNSRVEDAQGNRNPYVDYPNLVCRAWGFECETGGGSGGGSNTSSGDLVITGVFDGTLSGGSPKGVELFVLKDIADLSKYGIGSANNGGGTNGNEVTLTGSASTGDFLYIAYEASMGDFNTFFGFEPTSTDPSATNVNGDDAIELFYDETGAFTGAEKVIDVFGDINVDGTGQAWEYLDSWAYRVAETGPNGASFQMSEWTFGGIDELEGGTSNATASTPFPIGSYTAATSCDAPSVQITNLTSSNIADNSVELSWTRGDGDGVILVAKEQGDEATIPLKGTAYQANAVFGQGDVIGNSNFVSYIGNATSITITGLTAASSYDFTAYEYKGTSCYLTDSPATLKVITTTANDQDSEITRPTTPVSASSISSLINTQEAAVEVFKFVITDKGSGDGLSTIVSKMVLSPGLMNNVNWSDVIAGAILTEGNNTYEATTISDEMLIFDFTTSIVVSDGNSKEFTLSAFLKETVSDGSVLQFEVPTSQKFEFEGAGSLITNTLPEAITSAEHIIDVLATQFSFSVPASAIVSKAFTVSVSATDINNNIDTQSRSVSLTLTEQNDVLSSSTGLADKSMTNGAFTWEDLKVAVTGSFKLSVTDNNISTISDAISITEQSIGLFFSEYIEGSSSNKAIELFNASKNEISLANYSIERYNNGITTPSFVLNLSDVKSSLGSGEVLVIANPSADQTILDVADARGEITFYNGDDALALMESGVVVDMFGKIGEDPGTSWQVGATGATSEYTLIRKSSIFGGNANALGSFGTNDDDSEWIVKPQNSFADIGRHTIDDNSCTPPEVASAALTVSSITESELTLTWTRGSGAQVMIIGKASNNVQVTLAEGDTYTGDLNFGDGDDIGNGNFVLYVGEGTEAKITGLVSGTTYAFSAIEFNLDPTCYAITGASVTGTTITPNDQDSDIVASESPLLATSLSSNTISEDDATAVFKFNISDSGTADELSTLISKFTFVPGEKNVANWNETFAGAQLASANRTISTTNISEASIIFDVTEPFEILSGSAEELTLSVWMDSTVTDEEVVDISIPIEHGFIANGDGSLLRTQLAASLTSAAHTIDVTATILSVEYAESVNGVNPFTISVHATDKIANIDKAQRTVSLSLSDGAGQLTSATGLSDQSMTAGEFSWTDLQYDGTGEITINVLADDLSEEVTMEVFTISSALLFSEYIEGSGFNKAVEIYNASNNTIDLSNYNLQIYSNGASTPSYTYNLSDAKAEIKAGELIIVAHAEADPAITGLADATNSEITNFNGDDAMVIIGDGQVIDVIGEIGVDPGSSWSVGTSGKTGENTLVRKFEIKQGNSVALASFGRDDASSEWIVLDQNDFSNLGIHEESSTEKPTITLNTNAFESAFGDIEINSQSESSSYQVVGSNLTENVSLQSSNGFLLSINNRDFTASLALSPDQGVLSSNVYVRFEPSEAKVYDGTITHVSNEISALTLNLSGTGREAAAQLSLDTANFTHTFGSVLNGQSSATSSYLLAGKNLNKEVVLTVPEGFQLSKDNQNFTTTSTISPTEGVIELSIYVKFSPTAVKTYSGFITHESEEINTIQVRVQGAGITEESPSITLRKEDFSSDFGSVLVSEKSDIQFYSVIGENLSKNVLVTAPEGFSISVGNSFFKDLLLVPSNGSLQAMIAVQFSPTETKSYQGVIVHSSDEFISQEVNVIGEGLAPNTPIFSLKTTTFNNSFGTIFTGQESQIQTYQVSGENLTSDVVVTAPAGFVILVSGNNFLSSRTLQQQEGIINTTITVKFIPTEGIIYSGDITHTSSDFETQSISVNGTGVVPDPAVVINQNNFTGAFGQVATGSFSDAQSLTIDAKDLRDDLNIVLPQGFEISEDENFETSLTGEATYSLLPVLGAIEGTRVFIRFAPTADGVFEELLHIATLGRDTIDIVLSGNSFTPLSNSDDELSQVVFYPNPTTNHIWVFGGKHTSQIVSIMSVDGKLVLSEEVIGKTLIDINQLDRGVYFISIQSEGISKTSKLIVK